MGRKRKEIVEYTENNAQNKEISYSLPSSEQETVINFSRSDDFAIISTSDSTMKTKLDKLCENSPNYYSLASDDGYYKNYRVKDKSLISFRAKKKEMSVEAREAASERFKELHKEGKIGRSKKKIEQDN